MTAPTPDEAAAHISAKVDRLPDSDAITVEKTYVRAVLAELERLRGIEQQARALSIRNDRLYDAFVDATGYEPTLELGDDDD